MRRSSSLLALAAGLALALPARAQPGEEPAAAAAAVEPAEQSPAAEPAIAPASEVQPAAETPALVAEPPAGVAPATVAEQPAQAVPAGDPAAAPAPEEAKAPPLGFAVDLGVSSVYVFRGYNMFQKSSQWDQHAFLAPSLTWAVGETGLSFGYWGAYQLLGPNVGAVVDAGLGAENDLFVSFSRTLVGEVVGGAAFTAYLYPAASKSVAGTSFPVYLEPALFASWATVVDVGLRASYYHGVQDAVGAYRYLYLNPTVGKTLALSDRISLALSGGFGLKVFTDTSTPVSQANRYDLLVSAALPVAVSGPIYVRPSISWAWTDLPTADFKDEMVVFGGINIGAAL